MAQQSSPTQANTVATGQAANSVTPWHAYDVTPEDLAQALPKNMRGIATQELADRINGIVSDPLVAEQVRENFLSYTSVLADGRFKIADYLNAVTYVSFKLMGMSNQDAYKRTFPKRYQDLVTRGASDKDISAYVAAYNKGKLVNTILEQSLVPTWVLNQDLYQKAINKQAWLMEHASSEKVQTDAADSLLNHLKKPEAKQVDLNIGMQATDEMAELNTMLASLAQQQKMLIEAGMKTRAIAHQKLGQTIDITPEEVPASGQQKP